MRLACLASIAVCAACGDDLVGREDRILFVRGAAGTGGFISGGADSQLSDLDDAAPTPFNTGYGQLAALLREDGFTVEQVVEGADGAPLAELPLASYRVVVMASNNARYEAAAAAQLARYVRDGGGALFISDANWGLSFDHAPSSDQLFLDHFGLIMNQDGGGFVELTSADFVEPAHPILEGVASITGEGVSPCSVPEGSPAQRLIAARAPVRRNTAPTGPVTEPTAQDASLAVVEVGRGRVACHFDRNTFFNANGGGSALPLADNQRYARNLFAYLAGR